MQVATNQTAAQTPANQATLNIRLPGQYFDVETGLHDNLHRTYNPKTGRYLQPDPLGYPDGPDAYLYATGDPINKMDPLGLYEEDVHYYLTYFLAITAGLTAYEAQTIATANRYIDDNPYTEPYGTLGTNSFARNFYHFTQSGWDELLPDAATRFLNPDNPPLRSLHRNATEVVAQIERRSLTPCGRAQMYGEYLHAYEDTYAHRDQNNDPYSASTGHLTGGHSPDKTFNHVDSIGRNWQYNEARTSAMETAVFNLFKSDYKRTAVDKTGTEITINDLTATLDLFNRDTSEENALGPKIDILNAKLVSLGFAEIRRYNCDTGRDFRNKNFIDVSGNRIQQGDYPGTILRTPTATQACK
jgi:RHS repeat-associated protein